MTKEEKNLQNAMTEGVIWKQLLLFFFPIVLGTFFQQLYNTADSLIVGNFLGSEALAAVSSSGNLIFLMVGLVNGVSMGAGVVGFTRTPPMHSSCARPRRALARR